MSLSTITCIVCCIVRDGGIESEKPPPLSFEEVASAPLGETETSVEGFLVSFEEIAASFFVVGGQRVRDCGGVIQCWGSYIEKVTSYKLLVTYIKCNLVTVIVTCNKITKYLVTSYFYVIFCYHFCNFYIQI